MILEQLAIDAARNAHCPYSKFHVGAAVLCDNGQIVTGCNIENASYGLTVCAERVAIWNAVSRGFKPTALAVACPDAAKDAPRNYRMPCGACRQVIAEFMHPHAEVIVVDGGHYKVRDLLPEPFKL